MNAKKSPPPRPYHGAKTCIVYVDVGAHVGQHDHLANLILKQTKDALKDALVTCAERHGGRLVVWKDHSGTFLFTSSAADGCDTCCLAAMQMLDEVPPVKRRAQMSEELGEQFTIRIACDTISSDSGSSGLADESVHHPFKKHAPSVSVGNKVTITDRIFRQLREPMKLRFQKWKRSTELGVDVYESTDHALHVVPMPDDVNGDTDPSEQEEAPKPASALSSRVPWIIAGVAVLGFVILLAARFIPSSTPPVGPSAATPQYPGLVHTEEWGAWRKQMHEKLSGDTVSESTLAEALKKLPPRPEHAAEGLRRDQAIGGVIMAYKPVSDILWNRFGIDTHNFLGTGLSKPSSAATNYGAATVHEYLIKNHFADSKAVWMRLLDPVNDMRMTVSQLFEDDVRGTDPRRKALEKEILQRVKDKDTPIPAVIRFVRINSVDFSRKLGKKERRYVFASNLAEVWNLSIRDAANLSGYISEKGDTVYVLVFLPEQPSEVVPATWHQVLNSLPTWLAESD